MLFLGISGVAHAGKDTLCQILIDRFSQNGIKAKRAALADALKNDVRDDLLVKYGIDILQCSPEQKTKVRDELVRYGCEKRALSNNTYWTSKLEDLVKDWDVDVVIVPDIRFFETSNDEVPWINSKGFLVHITRYLNKDGKIEYIQPPNDKEKLNDPLVRNEAEFQIEWETLPISELIKTYEHYYDAIISYAIGLI